jgi:outer membrane receptor protein involved in Fe transport
VSFEGFFSRNKSNSDEAYQEYQFTGLTDSLTTNRDQLKDNKKWQMSFKADYTYPITDKLKLSLGYNSNISRIENSYENHNKVFDDISTTDAIKYNEDRYSAYSNLAWNISNFNIQGGVRFEASYLNIHYNNITNGNYNCFLPFASVQYKLGKKQTFRFNYRKSINRPGMGQISPFSYKNDNYTVEVGNPDLEPAYINKLEFTHRIQLMGPMYISYRPYFSFINKGIRPVYLPSVNSVAQRKYINASDETEYGITFSGTLAFVKWWAINPSYTYYKREITEETINSMNVIPADKRTAWRLGLSSQFILPKDWVIFVEYNYNSPVITAQTKEERNYNFVTGFYKKLNNKFNVTVFTLNPGERRYIFSKTENTTSTMSQNSTGAVKYNWIFNIRLGYSFNIGKEGKKVDRQVESDSDAGGKKGIL